MLERDPRHSLCRRDGCIQKSDAQKIHGSALDDFLAAQTSRGDGHGLTSGFAVARHEFGLLMSDVQHALQSPNLPLLRWFSVEGASGINGLHRPGVFDFCFPHTGACGLRDVARCFHSYGNQLPH